MSMIRNRDRRGIDHKDANRVRSFEQSLLPDSEKEHLARELLAEFGVTGIRHSAERGELIHSCCLPGGRHKNGDRNASASLNYRKLTYSCFGCGGHGGLLWFIAVCRGEDGDAAREWLNGATGSGGHVMELTKLLALLDALAAHQRPERAPIPRFDPATLDPWDFRHPYMTEVRGCHPDTLARFRVGYAHDYFGGPGRIIIPQFWKGDLVGWQARALYPGDSPKYKNSVEFPRHQTLYNPHQDDTAVIVESPLSVLRHHHHQSRLMATFGAQVTDEQRRLLHRHRRVLLWFDNDDAGWGATTAVADALLAHTQVWVIDSRWAADPADMTDDVVDRLIDDAVPYAIWSPPRALDEWKD
jgi:hypothetical protein